MTTSTVNVSYVIDDRLSVREVKAITRPSAEQVEDSHMMFKHHSIMLVNAPGTGKTFTTVLAYQKVKQQNNRASLLVLAPKGAIFQWADTLTMWMPWLEVQVITKGSTSIDRQADVIITTYTMLARDNDVSTKLPNSAFDCVAMDEFSGAGLGNHKSKTTQRVLGKLPSCEDGLIENAAWRWPIDGTPTRRFYDTLWPVLVACFPHDLINFGVLHRSKFMAHFCRTQLVRFGKQVQSKVCGYKNRDDMEELLYKQQPPIAIRREGKAGDVTHNFVPLTVEYDEEAEALFEKLEGREISYTEDGEEVTESQAISQAWHLLGKVKVEEAVAYIKNLKDQLENGVLVLAWHTDVIEALQAELEKAAVYDGRTKSDVREKIKADFKEGRLDYVVGQISAMGVAVDGLQYGSNNVVFVERPWSPLVRDQNVARLAREGQAKMVVAHYLVDEWNPVEGMLDASWKHKHEAAKGLRT